ncbi:hypothetical protein TWF696_001614 [Orbilia brochopaga]|uniref:Uncharacterized protein n=1 Tax=Orbilia brochopaga TaxID=3140254 RepID=A0AAV9U9Z1_9PEZI
MWWRRLSAAVCGCVILQIVGAAAVPHERFEPVAPVEYDGVRNANHIFNAIHSSMRQWGSSLNHNGMSLFLAQVPAGTQFYHGTGTPDPVSGMEWLAFEPEHALNFARMARRHDKSLDQIPGDFSLQSIEQSQVSIAGDDGHQPPTRPVPLPGWLHTYRTKETIPLLYIDGMSAGKCDKGTMDTQDVLLLNATGGYRDIFWEKERAEGLCKLARDTWDGKIKGFIRTEAGFEVILCSFSENLEFVRAVRTGPFTPKGLEPNPDEPLDRHIWDWLKFITARYDGIGGGRVKLDYDDFITCFSYDLDLFRTDDGLPRLMNLSIASLDIVRNDITTMVTQWDSSTGPKGGKIDWQSVADMIIQRYANDLKFIVSDTLTTSEQLFSELRLLLRGFVDSDARNVAIEINRCTAQFIPVDTDAPESLSLAGRAIYSVAKRVCSTLFDVFDANLSLSESREKLRALMKYLGWTVWRKCPECPLNKVCFIPIWPFGSVEDREHPQCRNFTEIQGRRGYWGDFQRRPPRS